VTPECQIVQIPLQNRCKPLDPPGFKCLGQSGAPLWHPRCSRCHRFLWGLMSFIPGGVVSPDWVDWLVPHRTLARLGTRMVLTPPSIALCGYASQLTGGFYSYP